ncbi:MAG: hypothetical protein R6V06_10520 [Kiritimatiellia bacterium]
MKTKAKTTGWTQRYQSALEYYIRQESAENLQAALDLGKEADALGFSTLDLAMIHGRCLTALMPDDISDVDRNRWIERADSFFTKTLTPIENTHGSSMKAAAHIHELTQELNTRVADLRASTALLDQNYAKRRSVEEAVDLSEKKRKNLDRDSRKLTNLLRRKTHEVLMTQEKKNSEASLHLQNDVAQSLLALDLKLLALKASDKANAKKKIKELDDAQQIMRRLLQRISDVGK